MLRRNKHPYSVDEKSSSGKLVIRYVKYRFLHSWVFVGIVAFWLVCSVMLLGLIWGEIQNSWIIAIILSFSLLGLLMAVWSSIVNRLNIRLEKKIVYPIIDKLLVNSVSVLPKTYRVKRRKLVRIDDDCNSKEEPLESIVVFLANGNVCEYPFPFVTYECNEGVIVRTLSLTHYVCNNERLIAKARGYIPEMSLNTWTKLISFLFLVLGCIVFFILLRLSYKVFFFVFMGIFALICLEKYTERSCCRKIFNVIAITLALLRFLQMLAMPFISVVIVTFFSVLFAVIPSYAIVYIVKMTLDVTLNKETEIFFVLVLSSYIIVYCPSYIRGIISRMSFVTHTEGKKFKKRMADLIIYVYDARVVEFFFNVIYVIFVSIICIKKYQNLGNLFSNEIDDVISNAFLVFLSFECVRSSYKRIRLSAKSFFVKILRMLES